MVSKKSFTLQVVSRTTPFLFRFAIIFFHGCRYLQQKIREIFAFREHKLSRIGQNRIFRVLNFRECTEKFNFFVVLRKRLDPDSNKREKKTLLFQAFIVLGLVFVNQNFF